ncbi:MAG: ABC transporter substrate-binding protein [Treponema sp.]|nr:ABC transporter substrate-binding protein [Treponema sp.]
MPRKKKDKLPLYFLALSALVFMTAVIPGCSKKPSGQQTHTAAELRYGYATEPNSLSPLNPSRTADGDAVLFNVFEGLVRPDTEGRIRPWLAESAAIEDSGRIYRFNLRNNVQFHDGRPLSSRDVKASLETAAAAGFAGLDAIDRIETEGSLGIRVILKNPDPDFLPYLTIGIISADNTGREKWPAGTGPYSIESYTIQRSLVLRKFKNYWRENVPQLEKITVSFLADSDALVLALLGGSIDGATLPGALAQQLSPGRFDIVQSYSSMVQLMALNNAAPPLNDIRVRQAINYGIEIRGIIDAAFFGRGEPSGSPIIPGLSAYYDKSLADPYPHDRNKAAALLAEAGYGEGSQKLSLEITVPSNYTMHIDTAQVIAGQLSQIGIDVSIKLVDWATWISSVYQGRQYQATIISLDSPVVSPRAFLSRYQSDSGSNFINFSSADFDDVYSAILAETDENMRIALYRDAQQIISANAASVYIQDILGFKALRAGAFGGVLSYPLSADDFASMYGK